MSEQTKSPGYFVFSLDTELGWGYFDLDKKRTKTFSSDGAREKASIRRVLQLCDDYGIKGTWALVGHLFYDRCEECAICPVQNWQGTYRSFDEIYKTQHPFWYAPDVVEQLLARTPDHELAFHGYTHEIFDENHMSVEQAQIEIDEWLRVAARKNVVPQSVVFPRGRVGFLELFKAAGFTCYRGDPELPKYMTARYVSLLPKYLDLLLGLTAAPVYDLSEFAPGPSGMSHIAPSFHMFAFSRRFERFLDRQSRSKLRFRKLIKGIHKAANESKVLHLWAHPWEFRTEKDFDKLRFVFDRVAAEIDSGRLQSVGMAELAAQVPNGHR